jgi:prepilin-type N-terminal cleavage/methylation domain-containing protein
MTLIELMVTMTILSIMVSVAVPLMKGLFEGKDITGIAKRFEQSVVSAKSHARKLDRAVRILPISTNSNWSQGWFLEYSIVAADGTTTAELIHTYPALLGNLTLTNTAETQVVIQPSGQATTPGEFVLTYASDCSSQIITYTLLISGYLQKRTAACP